MRARAAAALALVAALAGCSPLEPEKTVVEAGPADDPANIFFTEPFTVAARDENLPGFYTRDVPLGEAAVGRVVVRVDWSNSLSDIDTIVTTDACPSPVKAYNGECTVVGLDRSVAKPSRVFFTLSAAGNLRIFLYNFAAREETGTLTVSRIPTS